MIQQSSNRFSRPLRVGTRGSALAMAQTGMVIRMLETAHPGASFVAQIISSEGDRDKTSPLTQIGGRGVFTSALQDRLLSGEIDVAVHSAKDVPSLAPPGLHLGAYPDREDPRDALISRHGVSILELPAAPVIGTSSRRRAVQVLALRPDAVIRDLRGNIDTRLRKAQTADYDAIILAVAGITRMGWADAITEALDVDRFTPAPAQGAIAVEVRQDEVSDLVAVIDNPSVSLAVKIERAFLRGVGGGCTTPIGAHAVAEGDRLVLHAMLADDDGSRLVRERLELTPDVAENETFTLAQRMLRDVRPSWSPGVDVAVLRNRTVIVTGSPSQAGPLQQALRKQGADVQQMETLRILPPKQEISISKDNAFDWVVVTSPNAFLHVADAIQEVSRRGAKLAVVGERSAEAARAAGVEPSLIGTKDGQSLVDLMATSGIAGTEILCLLSDLAAPVVPEELRAAGASVAVKTAYRNQPVETIDPAIQATIAQGAVSAITFASPSAVESFVHLAGRFVPAMSGAAFVAIGETTAKRMRTVGLPVHAIAGTPDPDGMVTAVCRSLGMMPKDQS